MAGTGFRARQAAMRPWPSGVTSLSLGVLVYKRVSGTGPHVLKKRVNGTASDE